MDTDTNIILAVLAVADVILAGALVLLSTRDLRDMRSTRSAE